MIKIAVVGLGKMGLSHHAIINANPKVSLVGVCDSSGYLLGILAKNTGVPVFSDFEKMLDEARPDAVIIATPPTVHAQMVRAALERDIHVFCEKPFTLSAQDSLALAEEARRRELVTQVGYHYRFVGAFMEVKRLLDAKAIGEVSHILAEAYGPVVLKPEGGTWRTKRGQGGGALHDYAAHPIDLVNWYLGSTTAARGTVLNSIFSRETEDQVLSTLHLGRRTAQISANWSDDSYRKMSTRLTVWGTKGQIFADRQECQVYLREPCPALSEYAKGWNVRYTTDLSAPVGFYLRGEEYSAQLEHFVDRVQGRKTEGENDFHSAAITDRSIALMLEDAELGLDRPERAVHRPSSGPSRSAQLARLRAGAAALSDRLIATARRARSGG